MPSNGTSRKTPTAKVVKREDSVPLDSLFDDLLEDDAKTADIPKSLPHVKKLGNWDTEHSDAAKENSKTSSGRSTPAPTSAPMTKVSSNVTKGFAAGKPMQDKPEMLKCSHCRRAVTKHSMPKHVENCLNKKQEKQRKKKEAKDARDAAARKEKTGAGDSDDEEDGDEAGKKGTASKTGSKKRKAGDEGDDNSGPAKKKKKKEDSKAKPPRPKAPVDVEKQCGVELPQGGQCARSLTCKSHSMGAKRAVPGRSAPYDKLLMEYQRKNQAKLQKAQFDASAPNPDDDSLPSGPVDSEEERDAVMTSIARSWGGQPLFQQTRVPLQAKYTHNRIKGMLQGALGSRGGGGLFGSLGGGFFGSAPSQAAPAAPVVDEQGHVHARRGSIVPGARSMMAPASSRKGSVAAN